MHCIESYWQTWRSRDLSALLSLYCADGAYWDPLLDRPLTGAAIGEHACMMWKALPDLRFELIKTFGTNGLSATAWTLHGVCTGSWQGLPPTGQTVCLWGATLFQTKADKILSAHSYFDVKTLLEQLDF